MRWTNVEAQDMDDLSFCIHYLEHINNIKFSFSCSKEDQLRALMNITMPSHLSDEFYQKQDKVLQKRKESIFITRVTHYHLFSEKIALFLGDITTIKVDAIVNACNEKLLGCFHPLHSCVDNAIHSYAGLQVRRDLIKMMREQGHDEENGKCKVTKGYNLPAAFIFHTVGPKSMGTTTMQDQLDLKQCYLSCLKKADEMKLKTIAFPSISTGIYGYPIEKASAVAIETIMYYFKNQQNSNIQKVVFCLFSEGDYDVYKRTIEQMYR